MTTLEKTYGDKVKITYSNLENLYNTRLELSQHVRYIYDIQQDVDLILFDLKDCIQVFTVCYDHFGLNFGEYGYFDGKNRRYQAKEFILSEIIEQGIAYSLTSEFNKDEINNMLNKLCNTL